MAQIPNKLLYFSQGSSYRTRREDEEIRDDSIVFVEDDASIVARQNIFGVRGVYPGTCTTAAVTAAKVATTSPLFPLDSNGKPMSGTTIAIKYSNTNSYKTAGTTMTLNVNSTGAYPIYYNDAEVVSTTSANTIACGYKDRYTYYIFNGTQWVWLSYGADANTTYANVSEFTNDAGYITSYTETDPIFSASPSANITNTDINNWDNKQNKIAPPEIGSLNRDNVSGGGNISISGTKGQFPRVDNAGTYTLVTTMQSATQSYGLSITFGGNTYTLNTTNGIIEDTRSLTVNEGSTWSASVIGNVSSGTILSVKILSQLQEITTVGMVAITNNYNDLDNKPTIPSVPTVYPNMDGTSAIGSSTSYAKADHVHPSDTSRVPTTRTINNVALSSDITLKPSDIGNIIYGKKSSSGFKEGHYSNGGGWSYLVNPKTLEVGVLYIDVESRHAYYYDGTGDTQTGLNEIYCPDISNFVEWTELDDVAFSGSYNDLSDKPTIPTIPTNVSTFTNDAGYITSTTITNLTDIL